MWRTSQYTYNVVTKLLAVVEELDVPECIDVSAEGAEAVALGVDDPDLTAKYM
jgi:hypothetical protein